MAFTFGFYDSINHDRKYTAEQVSSLFDGLITDGVFDTIGNKLSTIPGDGLQVLVRSGKAWFNHTWSINDADYPLYLDTADVTMTRIDAIVLEVDSTESVRANALKVIKGTAATNPTKPKMTNTDKLHQYPLSYVTVAGSATSIGTKDIEIVVGMSPTPFVTGLVEHIDITDLFSQWNGEFDTWFENVKDVFSEDTIGKLQNQIDNLNTTVNSLPTKTDVTSLISTNGLKCVVGSYTGTGTTTSKTFSTSTISTLRMLVIVGEISGRSGTDYLTVGNSMLIWVSGSQVASMPGSPLAYAYYSPPEYISHTTNSVTITFSSSASYYNYMGSGKVYMYALIGL